MSTWAKEGEWKVRAAILFFGLTCGVIYQTLKVEWYGEDYWNIRLPIVLVLGILFFYVVNYCSVWTLRLLTRKCDSNLQLEDMKTYLPLGLVFFYPVQKRLLSDFWPASVFGQMLGIYVALMVILKCVLVVSERKKRHKQEETGIEKPVGRAWIAMASFMVGIPLFWFHQFTYPFEDFLGIWGFENPRGSYLRHNAVTRKAFLYKQKLRFSAPIPHERSKVVVGFKLIERPRLETESFLPVRFELSVTDHSDNLVFRQEHVLSISDQKSIDWHNFEFELPGGVGDIVHFNMKAAPDVLGMGWHYLSRFLIHNPLDIPYFRKLTVRAAWSEPEIIPLGIERPNVVLISIDALRADALGCYGYGKQVSPAIDSFAQQNVLFENAFSQASWTLPSHRSMLTSRFPVESYKTVVESKNRLDKSMHVPSVLASQKHSALGAIFDLEGYGNVEPFPIATLSDIFKQSGYYSAAFTDGGCMSAYFGFCKGFHIYNENYGADGNSFKLAQQWISENMDKDFFVFIHTYLVHQYERGKDFKWCGGSEEEMDRLLSLATTLFPNVDDPVQFFSSNDRKRKRDWYDARIRLVDSYMHDFVSFLKERNLYDNTMIVLTSDHGESFGDVHNDGKTTIYGHRRVVYDSQIRVPLIVKLPSDVSVRSPVVDDDVNLMDVAPTILAVLDFDERPDFRGRSVLPGFESTEKDEYPFVFAVSDGRNGCMRKSRMKYIYHEDGSEEFYDLANDPAETRNLASLEPVQMLELKGKYFELLAEFRKDGVDQEQSVRDVPPQLRENLKALGYIE